MLFFFFFRQSQFPFSFFFSFLPFHPLLYPSSFRTLHFSCTSFFFTPFLSFPFAFLFSTLHFSSFIFTRFFPLSLSLTFYISTPHFLSISFLSSIPFPSFHFLSSLITSSLHPFSSSLIPPSSPFSTLVLSAQGRGDWTDPLHLDTAWISVKLKDVNDNPPVFIQPHAHVTVREDATPGTLLATLPAHDPDMVGTAKPSLLPSFLPSLPAASTFHYEF